MISQIKRCWPEGRGGTSHYQCCEPPAKFTKSLNHGTCWVGREIPRSVGDSGRWALSPEEIALSDLPAALLHQGHQKGTNTAPWASAGQSRGQYELRVTQGMVKFLFKPESWLGVLDPSRWTPSLLPWQESAGPVLGTDVLAGACWWPPCHDSRQCPSGRGAAASHHGRAFPSADGIGNKLHTS